jgi:5-methylcytosine-specific restriction endonuclease McrA
MLQLNLLPAENSYQAVHLLDMSGDLPEKKVCLGVCGKELPLEAFGKSPGGKYGRLSRCKKCRAQEEKERRESTPSTGAQKVEAAQRTRDWYAANRGRALASSAKWAKDHPEKFDLIQRRYRSKPEVKVLIAERNKTWATQNRDKTREYARQWQDQNRELYHEIQKRWRAENQTYWRIRDKSLRSTQSDFTLDQWLEVLEEFGHCCAYCLRHDVKLTMDHVISIAKGGTHTRDNIVPACKSCNSRKKDRPIFYMLGFNGV